MTAPGAPTPTDEASDSRGESRSVLVVGDTKLRDRIAAFMRARSAPVQVMFESGWFGALGRLGQRRQANGDAHALVGADADQHQSNAEPTPDRIIGPAATLGESAGPTLNALRTLAGDAQIILEGEANDPALASVGLDPHCRVTTDLTQELESLLSKPERSPSAPNTPNVPNTPTLQPDIRPTPPPKSTPVKRQASEEFSPKAAAPAPPNESIPGDTDLIQAALAGGERVVDMAMTIARAHSGQPTLQFISNRKNDADDLADAASSDVSPPAVQVSLTHAGQTLGMLTCDNPAVSPDDLQPWANWISQWLGLDHHVSELTRLALTDDLTGAWNRRYFNRFLQRVIDRAARRRGQVTVLVFDIDDFKKYNDRYGHAAGDEILKEAVSLMQSVVREHDVVARIGGDEFAVIFWESDTPNAKTSAASRSENTGKNGKSDQNADAPRDYARHPDNVLAAARRFQQAICQHRFPKLLEEAPGTLTISGGLATFPWDGRNPAELVERADQMALKSKQQGKNAITFGPGALDRCEIDLGE